jgi:4a-hydroxytetrahydrobiopterin dehydratase
MAAEAPGAASSSSSSKRCLPCEGGDAKLLTEEEVESALATELPLWTLKHVKGQPPRLTRSFVARDFASAMAFLNGVAVVAEREGHHPDLHLTGWRNVEVSGRVPLDARYIMLA